MNKKFRYNIYLYFSMLLLVSVLILLLFSNVFLNSVLEDELYPFNFETLHSIVYNMDAMLSNVDNISLQLATDNSINYFLTTPFSENYMRLSQLSKSMEHITSTNNYIHSVYIYYPHQDDILTVPHGKRSRDGFFDNGWVTEISFDTSLHNMYYNRTIIEESGEKNLISYLRYIPVGSFFKEGAIIINLDADKINDILISESNTESVILLLDPQTDMIMSTFTDSEFRNDIYQYISEGRNEKTSGWQEKRGNSLVSAKSGSNGWLYVMVTPIRAMTGYKNAIRMFSVLCAAFLIAIGAFLIRWFSNKLYYPVENLASYFAAEGEAHNNKLKLDEFKFIQNSIERIVEDNKKNLTYALERIVWGLLYGNLSTDNIDINAESFPLLKHERLIILVTELDNYKSLIQMLSDEQINAIQDSQLQMINDIVSRQSSFSVFGIRMHPQQTTYIIGFSDCSNTERALQKVFKIADEVTKHVKENLGIQITTGISRVSDDAEQISTMYRQACEAVEYRMVEGPGNIIYYNNIKFSQYVYTYPQKYEDLLVTALKTANKEQAVKAIQKFVSSVSDIGGMSNKQIYYIFAQLLGSITKTIYNMGGSLTEIYGDLNIFDKFSECKFLNQMEDFLNRLCDGLIYYITEKQNSKHESIVSATVNYVDKNYSDSSISIDSLAEKVYISSSYLERMFKEFRGQTIIEYLNYVRMEKAKQLLKESNLKIETVAEKVGYNSSRSFIRAFKKYEGSTPGMFRNSSLGL